MGSPQEVIAPLEALAAYAATPGHILVAVISQAAKPVGRKLVLTDPPVAQFAKAARLTVLQPPNVNDANFLAEFAALRPDVVITAAYGQLLSEAFLAIPRRATINIHPSLLPAYRGATPVPAALLDGLVTSGISVLFTVKAMDAGNIIVQQAVSITPHEMQLELTERLFRSSCPLLLDALDKLADESFTGTPQDESKVTRCRKIKKEDGQVMWTSPATELYARFRAFNPWPGLYTRHGDRRVTLTAVQPWNEQTSPPLLAAGEFTAVKALSGMAIGTATEPLVALRLTPEGGREMAALAFLNGLKPGAERRFT